MNGRMELMENNNRKQIYYCNSGVKVANIIKTLVNVLEEHPEATLHVTQDGFIVVCEE
jgi:hypothetical protein